MCVEERWYLHRLVLVINCWIYYLTQTFDLSTGYRQIKSEPTIFVMLSYSWFFLKHTPLYSWSDQCYHRVHMMVEVQWYGNSDELLLSPSVAFCLPPWVMLNINLVLETCVSIFFMSRLWSLCLDEISDFLEFMCILCKLLLWIHESLFLLPLESSQVSHACVKYFMVW